MESRRTGRYVVGMKCSGRLQMRSSIGTHRVQPYNTKAVDLANWNLT